MYFLSKEKQIRKTAKKNGVNVLGQIEEKQLPCEKWISALTLWASCISCDNYGKKTEGELMCGIF